MVANDNDNMSLEDALRGIAEETGMDDPTLEIEVLDEDEDSAKLEAARVALIAVREWLWSGRLDPNQKPGAPIIAPADVAKLVNAALDMLDCDN